MNDDPTHDGGESPFSDAELQRAVREMQVFAKVSTEDRRGIRAEVKELREEVRSLRGQVADVQHSQMTKDDVMAAVSAAFKADFDKTLQDHLDKRVGAFVWKALAAGLFAVIVGVVAAASSGVLS